jgi:hypothetical protein
MVKARNVPFNNSCSKMLKYADGRIKMIFFSGSDLYETGRLAYQNDIFDLIWIAIQARDHPQTKKPPRSGSGLNVQIVHFSTNKRRSLKGK